MARILRRGMRGADVTQWQMFLIGLGLLNGYDGIFGGDTETATIAYQRRRKIDVDGVVANQTLSTAAARDNFAIVPDVEDDWPLKPAGFNSLANNAARAARFGSFQWRDVGNAAGEIVILGDWEDRNIVKVTCPIFNRVVRLHKDVADDYRAFMLHILDEGLQKLLLTDDGAFYPRYIRGSKTSLSNHAWGSAFDVNYEWNKLGAVPAGKGKKGSVREIVLIGVQHGWFWGGWFSRRDGMHFEHV